MAEGCASCVDFRGHYCTTRSGVTVDGHDGHYYFDGERLCERRKRFAVGERLEAFLEAFNTRLWDLAEHVQTLPSDEWRIVARTMKEVRHAVNAALVDLHKRGS